MPSATPDRLGYPGENENRWGYNLDGIVEIDPDRERVQRPQQRPSISTRFGLRLNLVDAAGKPLSFELEEHDLAHLALSIISAQERLQNERLAELNRRIQVP